MEFYIAKSKENNYYLHDLINKQIVFLPPSLQYYINSKLKTNITNINYLKISEDEKKYYKEKAKLLIKRPVNYKMSKMNNFTTKIIPSQIHNQLANLSQITFEVTDYCNLKCKYCGYGEIYDDYDKRSKKNMSFKVARKILDYIFYFITSKKNNSFQKTFHISFYGGEPLIGIELIKRIIQYIESNGPQTVRFKYNMTTNGILLEKYIDYIVEKRIRLLISLDGDSNCNVYRVYPNGKASFDKVINNAHLIKEKYPNYYNNFVSFNSVLHNKNSAEQSYRFIKENLEKIPRLSELSGTGIRKNKKDKFFELFQSKKESINRAGNKDEIINEMLFDEPQTRTLTYYLHQYSNNVYKKYIDLYHIKNKEKILPTGTCFPFGKRMYVTVNGKILPCERIGHQYALGEVNEDSVNLDFTKITRKYNAYYNKLIKQCSICHAKKTCIQCLFNIDDLENNPICKGFMNREQFTKYLSDQISYLEKQPEVYLRIMKEVTIE